jgi:hypothetical protein
VPEGVLKKSDLVVAFRQPGFEAELETSWVRLTRSGQAWFQSRRFVAPGGEDRTRRVKHTFNPSVLVRIQGLLQGLPPPPGDPCFPQHLLQGLPQPGRPAFIMEDVAWRTLHFWEDGQERSLAMQEPYFDLRWSGIYGEGFGAPYPAMQRLRALWALLHFPFEKP